MALENVGSFQYLVRKPNVALEKNEGPQFFNTRYPNGPWNLGLFQTLQALIEWDYLNERIKKRFTTIPVYLVLIDVEYKFVFAQLLIHLLTLQAFFFLYTHTSSCRSEGHVTIFRFGHQRRPLKGSPIQCLPVFVCTCQVVFHLKFPLSS